MLYFLKKDNLVKIGYSRNPAKRIQTIRDNSSSDIELLILTEGSITDEKHLHCKFKEYHSFKEWFILSDEIKEFIKTLESIELTHKKKRSKFFGELTELRLKAGFTLQQMAERLGVKAPSLQDMERGYETNVIQLKTLKKYLNVIGYEVKIVKKGS